MLRHGGVDLHHVLHSETNVMHSLLYVRYTTENDSKTERVISEVQTPDIGAYWFAPEPTMHSPNTPLHSRSYVA